MMNIVFSRHAQRRCQLYKLAHTDIEASIQNYLQTIPFANGQHEILDSHLASKYKFPVKIVFVIENATLTIITAYPLKKGLKP